jgi:hypothetical protein
MLGVALLRRLSPVSTHAPLTVFGAPDGSTSVASSNGAALRRTGGSDEGTKGN